MIFVRELEVWGYPGIRVSLDECDKLVRAIASELALPERVLIPYHSIPDESDVENLSFGLLEGELTLEDFIRFCHMQNIVADPTDSKSASEFLTFWYGQKLAWLHLPEEFDTAPYLASLSAKLKLQRCSLIDPDSLVCLMY